MTKYKLLLMRRSHMLERKIIKDETKKGNSLHEDKDNHLENS